jgi:hypothetical protein
MTWHSDTVVDCGQQADAAVMVVSAKDLNSKDDAATLINQALVLK